MFQHLKGHYQGVKTFINGNISKRWMSVVNFTAALIPRKEPSTLIEKAEWALQLVWTSWRREKPFVPTII
jgi:hypothetical protein